MVQNKMMKLFLTTFTILLTANFAMASSNYLFIGDKKIINICKDKTYRAIVNSNIEYLPYQNNEFCGVVSKITGEEDTTLGFYGSAIRINKINESKFSDFRLFLINSVLKSNFPNASTKVDRTLKIHDSVYDIEKIYFKTGDVLADRGFIYEMAIQNDDNHSIIIYYFVSRQLTPEIYTKMDNPEDVSEFEELWTDLMTWYSESKALLAPETKN